MGEEKEEAGEEGAGGGDHEGIYKPLQGVGFASE